MLQFYSQKSLCIVGCECLSLWPVGRGGAPRSRSERGPQAQPHLLADVLAGEDLPAGLAFKAAQVPLLFQRQQRLPVLDVPSAAGTVWKEEQPDVSPCSQGCYTPAPGPALSPCVPSTHSVSKYLLKHRFALRSPCAACLTSPHAAWTLHEARRIRGWKSSILCFL